MWNISWSVILLPNFILLPNVLFYLSNPEYMKSCFILLLSVICLLGFSPREQAGPQLRHSRWSQHLQPWYLQFQPPYLLPLHPPSLLPHSQPQLPHSPEMTTIDAPTDSVWVYETKALMEALAQMIQTNQRPILVSTSAGDYPLPEACYEMIFGSLSELGIESRDTQAWEHEWKRVVLWRANQAKNRDAIRKMSPTD